MNIHCRGTYSILLVSWEGAEHFPIDRIGIGCLIVEESGVESKGAREVSSLNIYRTGTYLTPVEGWEGAEHCPVNRIGIGYLVVEESSPESKSTSVDTSLITEVNSMD